MNLDNLRKQLKKIQWRVGRKSKDGTKAFMLGYMDAREARQRLNDVCGVENWQTKYHSEDGKTICELSIRINSEWITKSDGAGDTKVEAEKGAISDAFKRACACWGVGEYLYDLGDLGDFATYIDIDKYGKPTEEGKSKLEKALKQLTQSKSQPDFISENNIESELLRCANVDEIHNLYKRLTFSQKKDWKLNFTNVKESLNGTKST